MTYTSAMFGPGHSFVPNVNNLGKLKEIQNKNPSVQKTLELLKFNHTKETSNNNDKIKDETMDEKSMEINDGGTTNNNDAMQTNHSDNTEIDIEIYNDSDKDSESENEIEIEIEVETDENGNIDVKSIVNAVKDVKQSLNKHGILIDQSNSDVEIEIENQQLIKDFNENAISRLNIFFIFIFIFVYFCF